MSGVKGMGRVSHAEVRANMELHAKLSGKRDTAWRIYQRLKHQVGGEYKTPRDMPPDVRAKHDKLVTQWKRLSMKFKERKATGMYQNALDHGRTHPEQAAVKRYESRREKKSALEIYEMVKQAGDVNMVGPDGKIQAIEDALNCPVSKKVAHMMATSHEYKKPNVDGALAMVKNYKWELSTEKVRNIQGLDKPVDQAKVEDIAKGIKGKKPQPLIVVDKIHGIRPQSHGKKILLDGHHRLKALEYNGCEETPVYKGTYTGGAQMSKGELRQKTALDTYNLVKQASNKWTTMLNNGLGQKAGSNAIETLKNYPHLFQSANPLAHRQLGHIGSGAESVVDRVFLKGDGEVARKIHTPSQFYDEQRLNDKERLMKESPNLFGKLYGRQGDVFFNQYVKGKPLADVDYATREKVHELLSKQVKEADIAAGGGTLKQRYTDNVVNPDYTPTFMNRGHFAHVWTGRPMNEGLFGRSAEIGNTRVHDLHDNNIMISDQGLKRALTGAEPLKEGDATIVDFLPGKANEEKIKPAGQSDREMAVGVWFPRSKFQDMYRAHAFNPKPGLTTQQVFNNMADAVPGGGPRQAAEMIKPQLFDHFGVNNTKDFYAKLQNDEAVADKAINMAEGALRQKMTPTISQNFNYPPHYLK